jgi:hypothetical protein
VRRLADGSSNELVRMALRSGRADRPSDGARQRTAVALGVGAGLGAAAMTARAAQAAQAAIATGSKVATGSVAHTSLLAALRALPLATKILTIGVTAGALATGSVILEQHASQRATHVSSSAAVAGESVASAHSKRTSATPPSEAPSAQSAEAIPTSPPNVAEDPGTAPTVAPTEPARPGAAPSASNDDLIEGVSVLELARSAISEGDPARALRIVSEYERQFPKGDLREEAAAIRIEALIASGKDAEALAAANRFLTTSPNSPHARHVRAMAASLRQSRTNP